MAGQNQIGGTFHELRIRRQLSIKCVKQDLQSSTITHFEHGNLDMKSSNLIKILNSTFTGSEEFMQLLDVKLNTPLNIIGQISSFYETKDLKALEDLYKQYVGYTTSETPNYLTKLILHTAIYKLTGLNYQLSSADSLFVEEYLMQDGRWYQLEYIVFAALSRALPVRVNVRICNQMSNKYREFHLASYSILYVKAIYSLLTCYLYDHKLEMAKELIKLIEIPQLNVTELYANYYICLSQAVVALIDQQSIHENQQIINKLLTAIELIDSRVYKDSKVWLEQLGISSLSNP